VDVTLTARSHRAARKAEIMNVRTRAAATLSISVLIASGFALVASGPAQALPACSYSPGSVINGTSGNDVIVGTANDDTINGNGGNDQIFGMGGLDTISGGGGNDVLSGGDCDDLLMGGSGDDLLIGENGNDALAGDAGVDTAYAGQGNNLCQAEVLVPALLVPHAYEYFGPGGVYWGPVCEDVVPA
jgi:hypothetical protein